jgi:hypothetical protein
MCLASMAGLSFNYRKNDRHATAADTLVTDPARGAPAAPRWNGKGNGMRHHRGSREWGMAESVSAYLSPRFIYCVGVVVFIVM